MLAVDPGDEHVGWALGVRIMGQQWGVLAGEWDRASTVGNVREWLWSEDKELRVDELVIEKFQLYPGMAAKLAYSPMATAELIGKLMLIADLQNGVEVVMQSAMIKKPTAAQLAARKIKRVGKGSHARDAELHLYYRILRTHGDDHGASAK